MTEILWLLLLVCAVGAASFYAGWRSAAAYLNAAKAVSEATLSVVSQANVIDATRVALDNLGGSLARLTETVDRKQGDVEAALVTLFQGFERAGIVRGARAGTPRQVGEEPRPE